MSSSLKLVSVILGAIAGIGLIIYFEHFSKNYLAKNQLALDQFHQIRTALVKLDDAVLRAGYFLYFNNDIIDRQVQTIRSLTDRLIGNPHLNKKSQADIASSLKIFRVHTERLGLLVHDFLRYNAPMKNSAMFVSRLTLQSYKTFQPSMDADKTFLLLVSSINSALFLNRGAMDENFLEQVKEDVRHIARLDFNDPQKERLKTVLLKNVNFYLENYARYSALLHKILQQDIAADLRRIHQKFLASTRKEFSTIEYVSQLILLIFLFFLAIVLYSIYRAHKENERLKSAQGELQNMLVTDALTGLGNRHAFQEFDRQNRSLAIILVNIDGFKQINDFYGTQIGDKVLKVMAKKLRKATPPELDAKIFRLGGDDFGVVYKQHSDFKVETLIGHYLDLFEFQLYTIDEIVIEFGVSISASTYRPLLETADMALKAVKSSSSSRYMLYRPDMDLSPQIAQNIQACKQIKWALNHNALTPYFQPIFNIKTGVCDHHEALARLITSQKEVLSPAVFLKAAKEAKLSGRLTLEMLAQTIELLRVRGGRYSINITAADIFHEPDRRKLLSLLEANRDICRDRITFELLESEEIHDLQTAQNFIWELKRLGCRVAIDDFGSGYSNFAYLMKLQCDVLKIDGSLIRNIDIDPQAELIVQTIVEFAKQSGMQTVAEFVHSEGILKKVESLGIDYAQGFFLGKPQPLALTE